MNDTLLDDLVKLRDEIEALEEDLKALRERRDTEIVATKRENLRMRNVDIGEAAGVSDVHVSRLIREGVGYGKTNAGWRGRGKDKSKTGGK